MAIGTYMSIITLNVNRLNAPTKRHILNGYKNKTYIYAVYKKTHFRPKDTYRLKVRGWKIIYHPNGKQRKAGVAILISDKIDLKIRNITRNKEGHCQEAFNRRLPVCCFGSVRNPLVLINS